MADDGWVTESIVQFTRSPLWRNPVDNFVDENCFLFTSDEDMTLEQTQVHIAFRKLIDDLLTSFVQGLGVTLDRTIAAVRSSVSSSASTHESAKKVLQLIFYMDDFLTFHKMMTKRNFELDVLASRAFHQKETLGEKAGSDDTYTTSNGNMDEETALKYAIEISLRDAGDLRKLMELEDMQIQEALALSIAAEEERMRQAALQVQEEAREHAQKMGAVAAEEAKVNKLTQLKEEKENVIHQLEARALEVRQETMLRFLSATQEVKSVPSKSAAAEKPSKTSSEQPKQAVQEQQPKQAVQEQQPKQAVQEQQPKQAGQGQHEAPRNATSAAVSPFPSPSKTATQSGVNSGKSFGFKTLPSIQPSFKQLQASVVGNVAPAPEKPMPSDPVVPASSSPSREEMEARARYMREQREKILLQNKAKREKELNEYAANGGAMDAKTGSLQDSEKQMTLDLARRLRDDILHEARK